MENRFGNQSPFRNPASRPLSPSENYDPIPDQSLEASLSRLGLSSTQTVNPGDFIGVESPYDFSIGGGGYSPFSFQTNAKFQRFSRVQNAVDGQMGFGSAGTHGNPMVGPGTLDAYLTAASEPWQLDDGVSYFGGFNQYPGGSFLQPKKQLGNQQNFQFPIVPCSNVRYLSPDYGQRFDGLASEYSDFVMPNLNSRHLSRFPHYSNHLSLESLRGWIVCLAKDQYGSRLLQTKFEDPKEGEIEMVLLEVIDHIGELMRDQFGNYIVQKLVKVCNEKQRTLIILAMTTTQFQLISICLNLHGTRVVQRLLEHITSQRQISLVLSALNPGVVVLATDPNGHHVIQHCLIHFTNEDNRYLFNEIANNCFKIATNKHGCCVLQSCVDHCRGEYREGLMAVIIANAVHLAEDPFGNYVVQHLLGLGIPEAIQNLVRQLEGSYVYLSCNKYASNVVEKCLTESGEEESSQILVELLKSPNAPMLLVDPFGNFVMQSALSVSKGTIRNALLNLIRVNTPTLRTNLYGKKVLDRFDKMKLQHLQPLPSWAEL